MKKRLGQHFLFDPNILKKIVRVSGVTNRDTVVEIGPGRGTLTIHLAEHAKRVIAIEIDRKLAAQLKDRLAGAGNVEIIHDDALRFPFDTIGSHFRVVANIPYYITTPLIFRLLEFRDRMPSMTLMMQKEVARRIVARPGSSDYGVLSVSLQLFTRPKIAFTVSKKAFSPPPDVDSAVVHFEVLAGPSVTVSDEDLFRKIVKAAFSQRRKTILNSLRNFEGIREALKEAGIDPGVRPGAVGIEEYARLTAALKVSQYLTGGKGSGTNDLTSS